MQAIALRQSSSRASEAIGTTNNCESEAGRKGAAARRQKLEVLTAELAATNEAVFSCKATNNEEHAVDTKASKTHVSSEPKTTEGSASEMTYIVSSGALNSTHSRLKAALERDGV